MEHALLNQTARELTFELLSSDETRAVWPYDWRCARPSLEGRRVRHAVSVRNTGKRPCASAWASTPASPPPFDDKHTDADYDILFDTVESPLCLNTAPNGPTCAAPDYYLARNAHPHPAERRAVCARQPLHGEPQIQNPSACWSATLTRRIRVWISKTSRTR